MKKIILGIDEVGRGPFAGPLVVGACVLGAERIEGLTDSKKLTARRRRELAKEVRERAEVQLGWVEAERIDEVGLGQALREATRQAVEKIKVPFHEIIIDGTINFLEGTKLEPYVQVLKKADLLVAEVSAAAIVAKVARDEYMAKIGEKYPEYGFENNAGYGTAKHREAIERFGICPEHRKSFAPIAGYIENIKRQADNGLRSGFQSNSMTSSSGSWAESHSGKVLNKAHKINESKRAQTGKKAQHDGVIAEDVAASFLEQQGHEIIERNWRTRYSEVDIVSRLDGVLYFVEVKYRTDERRGDGRAAITKQKLAKMRTGAEIFLKNARRAGFSGGGKLAVISVTRDSSRNGATARQSGSGLAPNESNMVIKDFLVIS